MLVHAVTDDSNVQYTKPVGKFLQYSKDRRLPLASLGEIDLALAEYMDELCYSLRQGASHGSKLRHAHATRGGSDR